MCCSEGGPGYDEADWLPLSGLRHLASCERQFALVHVEQSWADNVYTAEGKVLHERVDQVEYETRKGVRMVRALPLRSRRLGLAGRADLVEFPVEDGCGGAPTPVEYKRGKPKYSNSELR